MTPPGALPRKRRPAGFTLVELLVAVAISALVLSALLGLLTSTGNLTARATTQAASLETLQLVTATIGDDVRQARLIEPTLAVPAWARLPGAAQAVRLRLPASAECAQTHAVAYVLLPRELLTGPGIDPWLRLSADGRNIGRAALLRLRQCAGAVRATLIADYLDAPRFAIAQTGSSAFVSAPPAATGGRPYLSVRTTLASARTTAAGTTRVPASGAVVSVATARNGTPP